MSEFKVGDRVEFGGHEGRVMPYPKHGYVEIEFDDAGGDAAVRTEWVKRVRDPLPDAVGSVIIVRANSAGVDFPRSDLVFLRTVSGWRASADRDAAGVDWKPRDFHESILIESGEYEVLYDAGKRADG